MLILNFSQPSSDIWLRNEFKLCNNDLANSTFNNKLTKNQPTTKNQPSLRLKYHPGKMFENWLRLRRWFLVDHCYTWAHFSTKCQYWGMVEKLIFVHWVESHDWLMITCLVLINPRDASVQEIFIEISWFQQNLPHQKKEK